MVTITPSESKKDEYIVSTEFGWNSQLVFAFFQMQDINSNTDGSIGDNAIVANVVNKYKNAFGKPVVVVIQSQLGNPICAYSGKDVYWKVCEDLPKTTKLMIDDKALYIHRANFQIIDLALLNQ